MKDRQIFITGATDGLGLGVAEKFAAQGARLILHGRNAEKLEQVLHSLTKSTGNPTIQTELADLMSLKEVDALANRILEKYNELHLLINNAGIGAGFANRQRALSLDGIEARFAVNYLSHYHLTKKLLPLLKISAPSRIVNIASLGQHPFDFADLMLGASFDGQRAYAQSKLAQIMFTVDLAKELEGSGVTVVSLHPASLMPTNMVREGWTRVIDTLESGMESTLYVATSPEVEKMNGTFFDHTQPANPNPQAEDEVVRRKLREASDALIAKALNA
jgi:NAD(P)-dependent dehydrogenase (short-subunit alcohol dehydrogenase family)